MLEQQGTRIAPAGEWLGTEESRQRALKEQEEMDKQVRCEFCDLCAALEKKLRRKASRGAA